MQATLGIAVFAVVMLVATFVSVVQTEESPVYKRLVLVPLYFSGTVLACYLIMALIGGVIWSIAWLGIIIREIIMWLVGALLYPWQWLF